MQVKHEPYYYWQRMLAEFSGAKGCNVSYGLKHLDLRYHDTTVASWYTETGEIVLRHGGWLTYYTKERINRFLNVLDVGAILYQHRKVWHVSERAIGLGRDWCSLAGHETEPDEFTLATRLTGAREATGGQA